MTRRVLRSGAVTRVGLEIALGDWRALWCEELDSEWDTDHGDLLLGGYNACGDLYTDIDGCGRVELSLRLWDLFERLGRGPRSWAPGLRRRRAGLCHIGTRSDAECQC